MATTYSCPNHSDVDKSNPGKCPKCGTELQAQKQNVKTKDSEEPQR